MKKDLREKRTTTKPQPYEALRALCYGPYGPYGPYGLMANLH